MLIAAVRGAALRLRCKVDEGAPRAYDQPSSGQASPWIPQQQQFPTSYLVQRDSIYFSRFIFTQYFNAIIIPFIKTTNYMVVLNYQIFN